MKHRITFLAFIAIAACSTALFAQQTAVEPTQKSQTTGAGISSATVEPVINTTASATIGQQLPRIIDFGSKQCKACKAMEPVLESLARNHADKFKTDFVDVWVPENQTFAKSYEISSIPTQVFLNAEGKEVYRNTGFISEEDIIAKFTELGLISAEQGTSEEVLSASETAKTSAPADESTAPKEAAGE